MTPTQQPSVTQALLPCPFCGGEPARHTLDASDGTDNEGGDVICCTKCQASSHVEFGRKENLVSRWNTRHREASTTDLRAENERLREALTPFAEMGETVDDAYPDCEHMPMPEFTAGQYRRAVAALSAQPDDQEQQP